MTDALLILDLAGVLFIFVAGSLLHFVYGWTGRRPFIAPFCPVNESVWEHFKLGFWPGLAFTAAEFAALGPGIPGFWAGKGAGLLAMPAIMGAGFYAYTALAGRHFLAADILLFLLAVTGGQMTGYAVTTAALPEPWATGVAVLGLAALAASFCLFTFRPPEWPVFRDPLTGGYGIPKALQGQTGG